MSAYKPGSPLGKPFDTVFMKPAVFRPLSIFILSLVMSAGHICFGQTGPEKNIEIDNLEVCCFTQDPHYLNATQLDETLAEKKAKDNLQRLKDTGGCEKIDFQRDGYTVRSSRVEDPFMFLPWVRVRQRRAAKQIAALVNGQPFRYETASGKALDIIEKENFLPDTSDSRVKIRVEFVSVENCSDRKLDLVYRIYSTQILPVLSSVPEARVTERQSPQTAAGQTTVEVPDSSPIYFTPTGGYDSSNKLFGGGRLEITPKNLWKLPFKSIIVQGQGSSRMKSVSAALFGSTDSTGLIAHAEWMLNYTNYSLPTGAGQLKGGHLSAQFSGLTRAFQNGNFTFRFGGLLEGGNRQSNVHDVPLAPDTLASAGYGSLKLYAGLNTRLSHNVLSISYGLELGSVGPRARVDWRKYIGDVRHEFWYPLGDHRMLSLESRFTIGRIQVPGKIPLAERFFGGNNEEFFIPGETWQIRANPVIRAIPGSRFYRTADGAGADRFFSYNLTAAYAIWRRALVPQELTSDPDFTSQLQGAMTTVTSTLQNYYASHDPHYLKVVGQLPNLQSALANLKGKVADSQTTHPGQFTAEFSACTKAINGATRRVKSAIEPMGSDPYGLIDSLLSDDPDDIQLLKVNQACANDLNAALGDSNIATASATVDNLRSDLLGEFSAIDQRLAESRARADMVFTRRTLKTLFNEVNIYSISPVFVFDVAKLSRETAGLGGIRYGPGAGIRLELATVAHLTAGYAWNVRQGPGEGRGTVFFSIGVRDLFH